MSISFGNILKGVFGVIIGIPVLVGISYLSSNQNTGNIPTQSISSSSSILGTGGLNLASEKSDNAEILQDVNFRIKPIDGDIMRPLLKGEFVTILADKDINGQKWYNVSQKGVKGWISYLAFISDPTKASASDCDPINGHVDEKGYCSCNTGYTWSGGIKACELINKTDFNSNSQTYYTPPVSTYTPTYYPSYSYSDCTSDCSGHDAGYEWASDNGITNTDDCDGKSDSFIEGCQEYVLDEYDGCMEGYDCEDIDSYEDCDESNYCSSNLQ